MLYKIKMPTMFHIFLVSVAFFRLFFSRHGMECIKKVPFFLIHARNKKNNYDL